MRIIGINTCDYGSTGRMMLQVAKVAETSGDMTYTFSRKWNQKQSQNDKHRYFGYFIDNIVHRILGPITGFSECFSIFSTFSLISKLKSFSPDLIHLHNLHGWYINLPMLFGYIKKHNIKVVWTLHDCWSFTGHCPHFDMIGCDKWKTGCYACPQYKEYPQSYFDNSEKMYQLKREWFTGVDNMTIVTPSQWLADLVKQSFLKNYPVQVIHNGIDLSVFQPTESDFRKTYNCEEKYILLGVAYAWDEKKGLDVFLELTKQLGNQYQIVLVGTNNVIDKQLPNNIISIHRTQNQVELAELYSVAEVFINPTREDNYPTVNMEALACGTPVITFDAGGSPEIIDESCGCVVQLDDMDALIKEIMRICETKPYSKEACLKRAKHFDMNARFQEYVDLYRSLV